MDDAREHNIASSSIATRLSALLRSCVAPGVLDALALETFSKIAVAISKSARSDEA